MLYIYIYISYYTYLVAYTTKKELKIRKKVEGYPFRILNDPPI